MSNTKINYNFIAFKLITKTLTEGILHFELHTNKCYFFKKSISKTSSEKKPIKPPITSNSSVFLPIFSLRFMDLLLLLCNSTFTADYRLSVAGLGGQLLVRAIQQEWADPSRWLWRSLTDAKSCIPEVLLLQLKQKSTPLQFNNSIEQGQCISVFLFSTDLLR